jgi:multicomponent Na+:H+ antiporter subunit D
MIPRLLPLAVAIPLGAGFILPLIPRKLRRLADALALAAVAGICAVAASLFDPAWGYETYAVGGWAAPVGIVLRLDALSWLLFAVIAGVSLCVVVYAVQYMDSYTSKGRFYGLLFLMIAGMTGVVLTGDVFNLYVFLEIAAISSYALVAFGTEAEELEASFKYAVLGSVASSFVLLGIAVLYAMFGTVNMAHLASKIAKMPADAKMALVFAEIVIISGLALKAALVPFHAWLPDAHPAAPAPVSAMLSGVLIKAIGVYALVRLYFNVFGANEGMSYMLMLLAVFSMIGGVVLALAQWDFKRLLAYHSISQIGYVVLGIALGTPLGVAAGLFHLVNHSVFKSLLFLNAGAVERATGTRRLEEMGGLRERMPVTGATSMVASMSIAGVPPFNGFFSKLLVIVACVEAGYYGFALLAVIGSILTLASFAKVQRYGFLGELREKWRSVREAPVFMSVAMVVLAVACLGLSLLALPGVWKQVLEPAADALLSGRFGAAEVVKKTVAGM